MVGGQVNILIEMINLQYAEETMHGLVQRIAADCRKMASGELTEQVHKWGERLTSSKGSEHAALQIKMQIAKLIIEEDK